MSQSQDKHLVDNLFFSVKQGGIGTMRLQPQTGKLLVMAAGDTVIIIDVDTLTSLHSRWNSVLRTGACELLPPHVPPMCGLHTLLLLGAVVTSRSLPFPFGLGPFPSIMVYCIAVSTTAHGPVGLLPPVPLLRPTDAAQERVPSPRHMTQPSFFAPSPTWRTGASEVCPP